ncbi:MAG TPA: hypothetical protein DCS93_24940 [Microscillaceae bacterium]|nr:hypothetical protein [Microscillaceae bacterium]
MSNYPEDNTPNNRQEHTGSGDSVGNDKVGRDKVGDQRKAGRDYIEKQEIKGVSVKQAIIGFAAVAVVSIVSLIIVLNWNKEDYQGTQSTSNQNTQSANNSQRQATQEASIKSPQVNDTSNTLDSATIQTEDKGCQNQSEKLRVDIAHFGPQVNQPFAFRLVNDVKDRISSKKYSAKVTLVKRYLTSEEDRSQVTAKMCDYRGLVVYGNRSTGEGNKSLSCVIDIVNAKKVEATHRLEEPSNLAFEIDEHSEYVSYFISGLLKYYLNFNDEADNDFEIFLNKIVGEKKTKKKNKIVAYVKYYQGRIKIEIGDIGGAISLFRKSQYLHKTRFCRYALKKLELVQKALNLDIFNNDLKRKISEQDSFNMMLRTFRRNNKGSQRKTIRLNLHNKGLKIFPERVNEMRALESLIISANQITVLPESISKLQNLKSLIVSYNRLRALPKSIDKLKNLEELFLNNNRFRVLPENICNLLKLQEITLNSNFLTSLPKNIGKLQNLERLYVSNNSLTALPKSVYTLKKIKILDLKNNRISKRRLKKIKKLLPTCKVIF